MPRIHGRNARLYAGIASSAAVAEPISFIASFSINGSTDFVEVTALGDTGKIRVAGLPDNSGDFAGFYDTSTAQLYTAAVDGQARKAYFYTDVVTTPSTNYWWGTVLFDFSMKTGVSEGASISGKWVAASPIVKVP